ncbi:hypothetical protein [uncultured Fusobacterium sp.]|uniref:hypothetical protein n=1 Tax=uncultured Fusobacterium sp. TaxID=159267 RepID=UPI0025ECD5DF|nr:hypothetical protein [uncultured Fusobacterium sp.]
MAPTNDNRPFSIDIDFTPVNEPLTGDDGCRSPGIVGTPPRIAHAPSPFFVRDEKFRTEPPNVADSPELASKVKSFVPPPPSTLPVIFEPGPKSRLSLPLPNFRDPLTVP